MPSIYLFLKLLSHVPQSGVLIHSLLSGSAYDVISTLQELAVQLFENSET